MPTPVTHKRAKRFDFQQARRTQVFVCTRVHKGAPILHVAHDDDGDWQFLCGGTHSEKGRDKPVIACLECVVAGDPTLNDLADLCCNGSADRDELGSEWRRHDHYEDTINEAVEEHGWFVAMVEGGDKPSEPPFAYTIGLHKTFGHPEIICVGLPTAVMHEMLNRCGALIKDGKRPPVGKPSDDVLKKYEVLLRKVSARKTYDDHLGYAIWFNGGRKFPVLQLLWPDKDGRFPGQRGVDKRMTKQQPLLP